MRAWAVLRGSSRSSLVAGPHFCGRMCPRDIRGPVEDVASCVCRVGGGEHSYQAPLRMDLFGQLYISEPRDGFHGSSDNAL